MPLDDAYLAHRASVAQSYTIDVRSYSKLERLLKATQAENERLRKKMEVEIERTKKRKEVARVRRSNVELERVRPNAGNKLKMERKIEKMKDGLVRQRARDLTTHAKTMLVKEREIEVWKDKCTRLTHTIQRPKMKDQNEFQKILAQQTKERMQLERHLALATESLQKTAEINVTKYLALEETNQALRQRLLDLDRYLNERDIVESEYNKKKAECLDIQKKFQERSDLCSDLERQLNNALNKNTELVIQNSDLQAQSNHLNQLQQECHDLKEKLSDIDSERSIAENNVGTLNTKLANLETVVRNLREAAEKRKELERDHAEALAQLRTRQEDAKKPRKPGEKERFKSCETIESLESKVRELQKKCELQNVCHEELMLEMTSLRRQQAKQSWSSSQQSSLTDGVTSPESNISTPDPVLSKSLSNGDSGMISGYNDGHTSLTFQECSYVNPELDQLMAKLEQDNRVLAELDKTRASIGVSSTLSSHQPTSITSTTSVATNNFMTTSYRPAEHSFLDSNRNMTNQSTRVLKYSGFNGTTVIPFDENAEFIEIPGKGQVQIFVAKYTYDPLMHSPNENPEAELNVSSGDYIIVYGDMDEDGFYDGELLDGKRGLVPSNFVIKLVGEDLYDFQSQVLYGSTKDSDDSGASFSQELDFLDDYQLPLEDYKRMNDYVDLEDIEEVDEDNLSEIDGSDAHSPAPNPPQRLTLERQLNKSILIAWLHPEGGADTIESYHIYVDGILKNTVKSQERTRALVEGVDSTRPHRISVRAVNGKGKQSKDAACTISIGKDSPLAPAYVTGTNITSTSAVISWLPSNSNFQHVICVNSVEVRIVKPGIFRHTITGLAPNTEYRVSVRAKAGKSTPSKSAFNDEKNRRKMERLTAYVDFKTLPKGLPDPPIDVQVESGPQDGTLLVTWLPVTISATGGTSNGCPVTGYSVYVDGKRMGEVESPTSDHTLLDISSLDQAQVKFLTVRTKSGESLSTDSISCKVPSSLKGGKNEKLVDGEDRPSYGGQSAPNLKQMLLESMSRSELATNGLRFFGYYQGFAEDFTEDSSDRDELSDIAEEPEEDLSADNLQQGKVTEKKQTSSKEGGEKETKKSQQPATKEKDTISQKKTTKETGTSPQRVSKDGKSQQQRQAKDSSTSHHHGYNRSRGPPSQDKYSNDRHHDRDRQAPPHGRHAQNPPPARDRGYVEKRGQPPNAPQPTPRRSNQGYNNGYHREGDYRQEEDYKKRGNYKKDGDYRQRDNDYRKDMSHRRDHRGTNPQSYREQSRLFVALFDYDPQTMSPNPDGADEELPFNEGQIIKIHGDKDNDGFYRGEANGRIGYVPCNMVSEVQADDEEVAHHLMRDHHSSRPAVPRGRGSGRPSHHSDRWNMSGVKKMVALYDYDPQELSPNVDAEVVELSFSTGDIIYVHGDMDEDGFFMGEIGGVRGLVPSNFLTEVPSDYRDGNPQRNELSVGKMEIGRGSQEEAHHLQQHQHQAAAFTILHRREVDSLSYHPNTGSITPTRSHSLTSEASFQTRRVSTPMNEANTLPIETSIPPIETNTLPTEANIPPIETNTLLREVNTLPTEVNILPTEANILPIETNILVTEDQATGTSIMARVEVSSRQSRTSTPESTQASIKESVVPSPAPRGSILPQIEDQVTEKYTKESEANTLVEEVAVMDTQHEEATIRRCHIPTHLQQQQQTTSTQDPQQADHTSTTHHPGCLTDSRKKLAVEESGSTSVAHKNNSPKKSFKRLYSNKKKSNIAEDDESWNDTTPKKTEKHKTVIGIFKGLFSKSSKKS